LLFFPFFPLSPLPAGRQVFLLQEAQDKSLFTLDSFLVLSCFGGKRVFFSSIREIRVIRG
jgi:hypothetical protein